MLPCNFISKEADKNKPLNISETAQNQLWLKLVLKYLVLIRMVSLFNGVYFYIFIKMFEGWGQKLIAWMELTIQMGII